MATGSSADRGSDPGDHNSSVWARGSFLRSYTSSDLRPAEVVLFVRYRDELGGAVLELGCGTGRIIGCLAPLARECYGMDVSAAMLDQARVRHPTITFIEGDFRDLAQFEDEGLDAVFAGCNVLDILADDARRDTLREIRRILRPGGVLLMSTHNRAYLPHLRGPLQLPTGSLPRIALSASRAPRNVIRHRRLRHLERSTPDYALVSDGAHGYSLVHYFIAPEAQARQLREVGFTPLECLDAAGRTVAFEAPPSDVVELHYAARRAADGA